MKKIILLFSFSLFFIATSFAQSFPSGINYQAVARDTKGEIISNKDIGIKISFYTSSEKTQSAYSEVHSITTNSLGLFDIVVGQGKSLTSQFDQIPWATEEVWIDIAVDDNGGSNYQSVSTSRLFAVPYAIHALTADKLSSSQSEKGYRGTSSTSGGSSGGSSGGTDGASGDSGDPASGGPNPPCTLELFLKKTSGVTYMTVECNGNVNLLNDLTVKGDVSFESVTQSNDPSTGALVVAGGVGIGKNLNIGGDTKIWNTTQSTNFSSGALTVLGGVGISKNLNVNGTTNLNGATQINNTLGVTGNSIFNNNLKIGGCLDVGNAAASMKFNCGTLNSLDDESFNNYALQITGSQVTQGVAIRVNRWSPNRNYISFWADGNSGPGGQSAGDQMRGRIENNNNFLFNNVAGTAESLSDPDNPQNTSGQSADKGNVNINSSTDTTSHNGGSAASANKNYPNPPQNNTVAANGEQIAEFVMMVIGVIADAISFGTSFTSFFDPVDIFEAGLGLAISLTELGLYIGFTLVNLGVVYESGSGDYAEYLPRTHIEEVLNFGDIVGVKGGEVSMALMDADKYMVVSAAPAMLGAMPEDKDADKYEKIAFMGQVPVKVRGEVKVGDYILPSGDGDGLGIALGPKEMKAKDFKRIVGVAWEDSKEEDKKQLFQFINVAVGINQNDMADMVDQMQMVMNHMQDAIAEVNPNYEGFKFNTDRTTFDPGEDYTVSPTHRSKIEEYFEGVDFDNKEELGAAVKNALVEVGGVDMEAHPVIGRMLTEPGYAEFAMEYYTAKMEEYQTWAANIKASQD